MKLKTTISNTFTAVSSKATVAAYKTCEAVKDGAIAVKSFSKSMINKIIQIITAVLKIMWRICMLPFDLAFALLFLLLMGTIGSMYNSNVSMPRIINA